MRVAMVAYAFYDGNSRIQQYATALAKRGDTVDLVALAWGKQPAFEVVNGVNIYRIQERVLGSEKRLAYAWQVLTFMLKAFLLLTRKHLKQRYQVVHVHSVPDFLVFIAAVPKLMGTPVILDIHDILPEFYATKYDSSKKSMIFKALVLVEKVSIAVSNHVIIANHIWYDRLIGRSVDPKKLTTMGNFPNPDIFFPRPSRTPEGKFIITYPGSLNWHQGLDIAIHAFAKVVAEAPEAEFHIYGDGPEKASLCRLASDLGLDGKVLFYNFLSTEEIAGVMAKSDLAVVPKRSKSTFGNEAASTKILEFMSVGIPVVVSRTKVDTLYHTDATVKFFDSDDPDELANAILFLIRNPEARKQLAANAGIYAQKNSWKLKKQDYFAIVDSLNSGNSAKHGPATKEYFAKSN